MSHQSASDQLVKYLADAHSLEEQALAQLRAAPELAGEGRMSAAFAQHLGETEHHERMVRQRLEQLGGSPSKLKDTVMAAGGKGFIIFARSQPDTPGKLLAHAYSYEHLEQAAYRLLALVGDRVGDLRTTALANEIAEQERLMGERLAECYDEAVEDSLSDSHLGELAISLRSCPTWPTPMRSSSRRSHFWSAPAQQLGTRCSPRSTSATWSSRASMRT